MSLIMKRLLLLPVALLLPAMVHSEWYSLPKTNQGQELRYDNHTNRVEIVDESGNRPLWSGIHKLEDGRVLRIERGVAVADEAVQQAIPTPQLQVEEVDPCTVLERKSCGLNGECGASESCELAHQLLGFYNSTSQTDHVKIETQCREALTNDSMFSPCPIPPVGVYHSACGDIVIKSCGKFNACGESEACDAARQLVSMEHEDRLKNWVPSDPTYTTRQCEKAFGDDDFFPPCDK